MSERTSYLEAETQMMGSALSAQVATIKAHPVFRSFMMGGFECATHRRRDGKRIDVLAAVRHDTRCAEDYRLLASAGIGTVRDGLRWHLIETKPYNYDWSSFLPMLEAAHSTRTQVIWDLCHWGVPNGLDPFSSEFVERFGAFAHAAATLVREFNQAHGIHSSPLYCPINEISFWAWVGGDVEHFYPYGGGRGQELKRQLVRASVVATERIREVDGTARFIQPEPVIQISTGSVAPEDEEAAARHTASQFEAWDMLVGNQAQELGGSQEYLDILGVNYYWNNQWVHQGERTPPGHSFHRPLHEMLLTLWERYQRPIVITETGAEGETVYGWLGYVSAEARQAQRMGVPILGICIYPVMDYLGWDDERHCPCGLIEASSDWSTHSLREDLGAEVRLHQALFTGTAWTKI